MIDSIEIFIENFDYMCVLGEISSGELFVRDQSGITIEKITETITHLYDTGW